MLPKFTGLEDAYLFLREFEEVCSVVHFPNIPVDVVRMKLISFALKDSAKCWMYGLATRSVTPWDDFVKLFLRKYFPNTKAIKLRNEVNQFVQLERESFWKYLDRFKNLLPNVLVMVLISHVCVKLFMRGLTSKLESCLSPCVRGVSYLRVLL